jgi:hypothetical protein
MTRLAQFLRRCACRRHQSLCAIGDGPGSISFEKRVPISDPTSTIAIALAFLRDCSQEFGTTDVARRPSRDTGRLGSRNGRGVGIRLTNWPLVATQFVRDLLRRQHHQAHRFIIR